jgi:hypothetical protein
MSGNLTPMIGKRVAEIMATRSFSEFVVVGGTGLRVLAPDGSRPRGVQGGQQALFLVLQRHVY